MYAYHPHVARHTNGNPTLPLGDNPTPPESRPPINPWIADNQKPWMQVIISLALMTTSLLVITSKGYAPKDKHWAYGIIGTLLGFWLR
jgi:hypothetical protein